MRAVAVEHPGARTTIEDLGRRHAAANAVPPGGAFDAWALIAANRLVGNPDDAAGLEITVRGPTLANVGDAPISLALVGSDFGATIEGRHGSRSPSRGGTVALAPGERLYLGQAQRGVRAWLALAGGISVPRVLGSHSTDVGAGLGGYAGRALRAGDRLAIAEPTGSPATAPWSGATDDPFGTLRVLRIVDGPQRDLFRGDALAALAATLWSVHPDSNRTGVRFVALDPSVAQRLAGLAGIAPEGTTLGALQIPPAGEAIALGPDRPVTGGYAKPALIARADVPLLAQLRPGERVRFTPTLLADACRALEARIAALPPPALGNPAGAA